MIGMRPFSTPKLEARYNKCVEFYCLLFKALAKGMLKAGESIHKIPFIFE